MISVIFLLTTILKYNNNKTVFIVVSDSSHSSKGLTDPATCQPPHDPVLSDPAPSVASFQDSNPHYPQGLSINASAEDTHIPEYPSDSYQNSNYSPAPRFPVSSPSGATSDQYRHEGSHHKSEDTHAVDGGVFRQPSNQSHTQTQENADSSSQLSTSTDEPSTEAASGRVEPTARYPLNIKNKLQRSTFANPGLIGRASADEVTNYTNDDRAPLHPTGPNMEHVHIPKSKKPVPVQDKDEKTPNFVYVLACFATIGGLLFGYDTGRVINL